MFAIVLLKISNIKGEKLFPLFSSPVVKRNVAILECFAR
jgi:hypothetical protein